MGKQLFVAAMIVSKIFFLVLSAASRMFLESRSIYGVHSNIGMTVQAGRVIAATIAVGTSVFQTPPPNLRERITIIRLLPWVT